MRYSPSAAAGRRRRDRLDAPGSRPPQAPGPRWGQRCRQEPENSQHGEGRSVAWGAECCGTGGRHPAEVEREPRGAGGAPGLPRGRARHEVGRCWEGGEGTPATLPCEEG